jgi:hypothetical protein
MAALNRPTNATYEVHENVVVDTQDHEDHTFCGIMFPVKCKDLLPVDHLVIKSVAVRGDLGPLTVWVSNPDANDFDRRRRGEIPRELHRIRLDQGSWTKLYDRTHDPCPYGRYEELVLDEPVRLQPGEVRAFYIHSTLDGDEAIVYDNAPRNSHMRRYDDDKLCIMTGRAHLSPTCFGQSSYWGGWGAWRENREFVGRLSYGTVYKLWNPEVQPKFGSCFQDGARVLALCQRRDESPFSMLPDEAIFYILNMCRWDWFDDCTDTMKDRRKREKARNKRLSEQAATARQATIVNTDDDDDRKPAAKDAACARSTSAATGVACEGKTNGLYDSEESDDDESFDMKDADAEKDENDMQDDDDDEEDDDDDDDDDDEDMEDDSSGDGSDYGLFFGSRDHRRFTFQCDDSDDETNEVEEERDHPSQRSLWLRHQFTRAAIIRALASMEDHAIYTSR